MENVSSIASLSRASSSKTPVSIPASAATMSTYEQQVAKSGFLIDSPVITQDSTTYLQSQSPFPLFGQPGERTKDAAKLASLVMNLRLSADNNTLSAGETSPKSPHEAYSQVNGGQKVISSPVLHASAGTKARATRAKARLELYYQMIANFQTAVIPEPNTESKMIGGVYNPLQTIRDRTYRNRRDGMGGPSGPNTHFYNIAKNSFLWQIEPSELVHDFGWRPSNLKYIRDRFGRPIYQLENEEEDALVRTLHAKLSQTKLLTDDRDRNSSDPSLNKSDLSDYDSHETSRMKSAMKNDSDAHDSSTVSDENSNSNILDQFNEGGVEVQVIPPSERSTSPIHSIPIEKVHRENTKVSIIPSASGSTLLLPISSADSSEMTPSSSNADSSATNNRSTSSDLEGDQDELKRKRLQQYAHELQHLKMAFSVSHMKLARHPHMHVEILHRLDLSQIAGDLETHVHDIQQQALPKNESQLLDIQQNIKALKGDFQRLVAPRLDSILFESDRMVNEVSTSLNLEIRKLGDRIDKLEYNKGRLKLLKSMSYSLLEYTLLFIMWIAWGFVSLVRGVRGIAGLILGVVKWLMWC